MKVYRVETPEDHRGPYSDGAYYDWRTRPHICPDHPGPRDDFGVLWEGVKYGTKTNMRYGFTTTEQLLRWFSHEERLSLEELGFVIAEYEVPYVLTSEKQCVFEADLAKRLGVHSVSDFGREAK